MQVSLITCTNNSEKTIKDCCLSIFSQTYENLEHIILDKNSQDETISIVKKYGRKNLKIYQQKSFGIYGALNEGMKMSNGNIIFKVLRRSGYLEKIIDLKKDTYDKLNSIK